MREDGWIGEETTRFNLLPASYLRIMFFSPGAIVAHANWIGILFKLDRCLLYSPALAAYAADPQFVVLPNTNIINFLTN